MYWQSPASQGFDLDHEVYPIQCDRLAQSMRSSLYGAKRYLFSTNASEVIFVLVTVRVRSFSRSLGQL
jgi:hypothetical protein